VRRHRGRTAGGNFGGNRIDDFDIEVGGLQRKLGTIAMQKHIGQDRYRVAALDHAMDMA